MPNFHIERIYDSDLFFLLNTTLNSTVNIYGAGVIG